MPTPPQEDGGAEGPRRRRAVRRRGKGPGWRPSQGIETRPDAHGRVRHLHHATWAFATAITRRRIACGLALGLISGKTIALSAIGAFTNNRGSDAVSASDRWLVYSSAPNAPGENFGNLNSNNTAIWGNTFVTLPPASVTLPGNRYIFATPATLTVTSLNQQDIWQHGKPIALYSDGIPSWRPKRFLRGPHQR